MTSRLLLALGLSLSLGGCFVPVAVPISLRGTSAPHPAAPSEVQAAYLPLGFGYQISAAQPQAAGYPDPFAAPPAPSYAPVYAVSVPQGSLRPVAAMQAPAGAMRRVMPAGGQPATMKRAGAMASGGWPAGANCAPPPGGAAMAAEVLSRVNALRRAAGLGMLFPDPALAETARHHACDLAAHGLKGHVGSDGSHLRVRMAREGYDARAGAENAGHGYENSPDRLVEGWMGSPGHRQNLLDPNLSEAGVGVALDPLGPDGRMKWVMVYGLPG